MKRILGCHSRICSGPCPSVCVRCGSPAVLLSCLIVLSFHNTELITNVVNANALVHSHALILSHHFLMMVGAQWSTELNIFECIYMRCLVVGSFTPLFVWLMSFMFHLKSIVCVLWFAIPCQILINPWDSIFPSQQ